MYVFALKSDSLRDLPLLQKMCLAYRAQDGQAGSSTFENSFRQFQLHARYKPENPSQPKCPARGATVVWMDAIAQYVSFARAKSHLIFLLPKISLTQHFSLLEIDSQTQTLTPLSRGSRLDL